MRPPCPDSATMSRAIVPTMVDFKKRLAGKKAPKPTNPIELYDTLDRAHDKGPLRPAQIAVLNQWHQRDQSDRDAVVKLHTGQGKTLIGLLILQSRLNANQSPVVYLCPNNFLISQACEQARQFGISTCETDSDLPDEFLNGQRILVTSVQKLFNGLTKFGLGAQSVSVDTILIGRRPRMRRHYSQRMSNPSFGRSTSLSGDKGSVW